MAFEETAKLDLDKLKATIYDKYRLISRTQAELTQLVRALMEEEKKAPAKVPDYKLFAL